MAPTLASTSAAGDGLKIPADLGISTIDAPSAAAYPIASQTFIDVYKDVCKAGMKQADAKALGAFLDYGLGEGQASLEQLYYAKLPAPLLAKAKAAAAVADLQRERARAPDAWRLTPRPRSPGGRSLLERPLRARLPDRALRWVLTALAAGILRADRVLLRPPDRRGAAGAVEVRRPRLHLRQQLGRLAQHLRRAAARRRHADHLGDRAGHRRAGRGRHRASS